MRFLKIAGIVLAEVALLLLLSACRPAAYSVKCLIDPTTDNERVFYEARVTNGYISLDDGVLSVVNYDNGKSTEKHLPANVTCDITTE